MRDRCRVKFYGCGWWHEQPFPGRNQGEAFAATTGWEKHTEVLLMARGR
jgi:hypothetical protein